MNSILRTQPSAKSEAMGRSSAALSGSPFFAFYNPASSSFLDGISLEINHLELYEYFLGTDYNNDTYTSGVNLKEYGAITFGVFRSKMKMELSRSTLESFNASGGDLYTPTTSIYMINYSYPVAKGLSAGININYFEDDYGVIMPKGWMADLGLMKKFERVYSDGGSDNITLGLSINNISNTRFWDKGTFSFYLPSVLRLGALYEILSPARISNLRTLEFQVSAEYYDLLNSKDHTQYRIGTEVTLLEMLKLRGGWYYEKLPDYGDKSFREIEFLKEFTYGLGVEVPVRKLFNTEVPLNIRFDHTFLESPKYSSNQTVTKTCPVYSLNISYGL